MRAAACRGCYYGSVEQLTPARSHPPSIAALAFVITHALASPRKATQVARLAVARYSISPTAIETIRTAKQ